MSVLGLALAANAACACDTDEATLFGCETLDAKGELTGNGISICGGHPDDGTEWPTMRYVYDTPKGVELSYPADPADGKTKLFFHHYFKSGLYHARVRFENGGLTYEVHFDDNPPSQDPDEIVGPDAGVRVMKGKTVLSDIACGERPASYFDDIRKGTACDMDNPFGQSACAADAPEVK
jgi:hypothetical protein